MSPGVHDISANTTVDAAVSVSPTPAALIDMIATRTFVIFWKSFTRFCLVHDGVFPSMRMLLILFLRHMLSTASSIGLWCPKTISFQYGCAWLPSAC